MATADRGRRPEPWTAVAHPATSRAMRPIVLTLLLWPALAAAGVLNVEFKFTPFTGDAAKEDHVESVPGQARVLLNGVPYADQPVQKQTLPVLFDEHEVFPPRLVVVKTPEGTWQSVS